MLYRYSTCLDHEYLKDLHQNIHYSGDFFCIICLNLKREHSVSVFNKLFLCQKLSLSFAFAFCIMHSTSISYFIQIDYIFGCTFQYFVTTEEIFQIQSLKNLFSGRIFFIENLKQKYIKWIYPCERSFKLKHNIYF